MSKLRSFVCKKCNAKVQALATDVTHRCPANNMRLEAFQLIRDNDESNNTKR